MMWWCHFSLTRVCSQRIGESRLFRSTHSCPAVSQHTLVFLSSSATFSLFVSLWPNEATSSLCDTSLSSRFWPGDEVCRLLPQEKLFRADLHQQLRGMYQRENTFIHVPKVRQHPHDSRSVHLRDKCRDAQCAVHLWFWLWSRLLSVSSCNLKRSCKVSDSFKKGSFHCLYRCERAWL